MTIKSSQTLVSNALSEVKTITADDALKLSNEGKCTLIDIREKGELDKAGRIENSNHIPRGMLEFWLDPEGPYFKSGKIDIIIGTHALIQEDVKFKKLGLSIIDESV